MSFIKVHVFALLYLSTYIPIYLYTYLPVYLSTYIPIYLYTYLPIYLSTCIPSRLTGHDIAFEACISAFLLHLWVSFLMDQLSCLFSFFSNTNFTEKTIVISRIRTGIVGVKGKYADHLTITTVSLWVSFSL